MYFGRGKNKTESPYVFKDMYKSYIQDKDVESPYNIPYSLYVELCSEFYKEMSDYILKGGLYIMPYRMGTVSVAKLRPKELNFFTMSLDWQKTAELGKQVFHTNDHTNYYKYRFHWSKKDGYFTNKSKYRMVFTRANKRKLAEIIKTGEYDYFELD